MSRDKVTNPTSGPEVRATSSLPANDKKLYGTDLYFEDGWWGDCPEGKDCTPETRVLSVVDRFSQKWCSDKSSLVDRDMRKVQCRNCFTVKTFVMKEHPT